MAVPLVIIHFQIGFSLTKTIQLLGTRVPLGGIRWMLVAACANPLKNLCHLGLLATQYYWEKKEKTSSKHQHWICPSLHDCSCLDLDPQQSKLRGKYLIPQAGTKKKKQNPTPNVSQLIYKHFENNRYPKVLQFSPWDATV